MNPQVPDELISAYFDGEVTPEERAAVERLLAENDESQRELNETARLSALLHSFPRESAPVDLAAAVLQETNLLPMPTVPQTLVPGAHRSTWGEWRAALISSMVTAAALVLVAWGLGHFEARQAAPSVATNSAPPAMIPMVADDAPKAIRDEFGSEPIADSKVALDDQMQRLKEQSPAEGLMENSVASQDVARKQMATDGARQEPLSRSAPLAAKGAPRFANEKSVSEAIHDKPAAAAAQMPSLVASQKEQSKDQGTESESLQIDNYSNLLSNQAFLEKLQVGEMYTFVPQVANPDNTVGVVDLEVVDIDRGAETMQVLLRKNEIQPRSVNDVNSAPQKKLKHSGDDLVVVYAVAPGDRLVQALNDVNQHPDLFRSWSSQVPLQVAEDEAAGSRLSKGAETAKDKSEVDRARATVAMRQGAVEENETAEAQRALATLVARGASLQNNGVANPAGPIGLNGGTKGDSLPSPAAPAGKPNGDVADLKRNELQQRQSITGKGDYEVMRVPVSNPVAQLNSMSRAMQQNGQNGMDYRRNGLGAQLNDKAAARLDSNNNRAVRMLFVLHPAIQSNASQAAPAPAATKAGR